MWSPQPLTPLMEGPDPEMQEEGGKKESSWEAIREWFRAQKGLPQGSNLSTSAYGSNGSTIPAKRQDLRLLLGVLGCPLAPIPQASEPVDHPMPHIKDIPFVRTSKYLELITSCSLFLSLMNEGDSGNFDCALHYTTVSGSKRVLEAAEVQQEHVCEWDGEDGLL